MYACKEGHTDVVKLLLEDVKEKINFNAKCLNLETAFFKACHNGHTDIVQMLLDHPDVNIDFNAKYDDFRMTALMWACRRGHKDVVKLLLHHSEELREKRGQGVIDLDTEDNHGKTAQMLASSHTIVQLLLDSRNKITLRVTAPF